MPPDPTPEIRWSTRQAEVVATRLRALGMDAGPDGRIVLRSATIRIVAGADLDDRLEVAGDLGDESPDIAPSKLIDVVAIGWATVDRDRVAAALVDADQGPVRSMSTDPHLNAYVLQAGSTAPARLVLEPDTEGRLAATLARVGEGPVAVYVSAGPGGLAAVARRAHAAGGGVSTIRLGPFGSSVIVLGGPAWGPHVIVVEPARDPAPEHDGEG